MKSNKINNSKVLICFIIGIIGLITLLSSCQNSENNSHFFVEGGFFSKMKSAASKVKSSVNSSVNKVKNTVQRSTNNISSNIKKSVNSVKAVVQKTEKKFEKSKFGSKVVKKITNGITTAKKVTGKLKTVTGNFKKAGKKLGGDLKKNFKNTGNKLKNAGKKFGNKVKSAGNKFGNKVKSAGKKLGNKVKSAGKKLGNKVKSTGKKFGNKVKNAGKKFGNKVKSAGKKLGNKVKSAGKKLKNKLKNAGNKLKKVGKKIGTKVKKAGKQLKSKVSKARAKLRAVGAKLDNLFKKGKKSLVDVRKKLKANTMKKIEKLKKSFGKIKSGKAWKVISKAFNKAKTTVKGIKQAIKNAKAKDKSKVIKLGSTNKLKPNSKVVKSVTAGEISLASQFSKDAYEKNSDKKLASQGYKLASTKENLSVSKVYYNEKDKSLVVTFRGTATLNDWKTNLTVGLKSAYFNGKYAGKVHSGYYKEYMKDREAIQKIIKSYEDKGLVANIVFTGHSKGGALGEIAATDYQLTKDSKAPNAKLITFGSPRTGDEKHAEIVNENVPEFVRVVNTFEKNGKQKQDLVSTVPPKFLGYVHAGTQVEVGCGKTGGVACHLLDTYLPNTEIQ